MRKIINVPEFGDLRMKHWAKTLTRVDQEKTNGYAFEGNFINVKADLEVGSFILCYGRSGSMKSNTACVAVYRVTEEGTESVYEKFHLSEVWALEVRDEIASIVNASVEESNPLEAFTTEQLLAEIARRNS